MIDNQNHENTTLLTEASAPRKRRKRSLFKKEVSVFKAIGMMRKGKKAYLKKRRQNNDT